jgi:hypothetical protein
MKGMMRRVVLIGMLTAISIGSGGCFQVMGQMAHDDAVKNFPTYAQTKAAWGAVPEGYGRVVFFINKLGMNPFTPVAGSGYVCFAYEVDAFPKILMIDQTFVFIDLPAGRHSIGVGNVASERLTPTEFDLLPGEIKYINGNLKTVPSQEAEKQLEKIHHNFQKALPFNKQSRYAVSATMPEKRVSASTPPDELVASPVAPAANNLRLEGSVNVQADIPIMDNGRFYVKVQSWVDNVNLKAAIEKAIAQNGLFTRVEQGNADYVLDVWVENVQSRLEIFGEGFIFDMTSIWRLTRTKDGKVLVCDFVKGHGAAHAVGQEAHRRSLIIATRETIQKGLLMLSDQSDVHLNAVSKAGSQPSIEPAAPERK